MTKARQFHQLENVSGFFLLVPLKMDYNLTLVQVLWYFLSGIVHSLAIIKFTEAHSRQSDFLAKRLSLICKAICCSVVFH